jgi:glutamyl-tRNA reductase
MSVLVVGLSHKSAPVAALERAVLTPDALVKLLHDVCRADDVASSLVVSTCNRVEVYAEVGAFHGGVAAICELLARHSGMSQAELTPHLYVHYEDRAAQHLLAVASGLDSMVLGESQILGQVRSALKVARDQGTLGRSLSELGSLALRAGKRAQTETGIGRAGANLISVGLGAAILALRDLAEGHAAVPARRDDPPEPPDAASELAAATSLSPRAPLAGLRVLVVGAGSMSALAVAAVARAGAASVTVANRTASHARRLAATVAGQPAEMSQLPALLAEVDLVVSCTGAPGHVITADMVRGVTRSRPDGPLVLLDLALPRDVDPAVTRLRSVAVVDLATLAADGSGQAGVAAPSEADAAAVRRIISEELAAHLSASRAAKVAPTVVALRAKADQVVEAELSRLAGRMDLDAAAHAEIAKSMRRVADKLLHAPTVRVKELAGSPGADSYDAALRVLFDLDQATVQSVAIADADLADWQPGMHDSGSEEATG